MALISLNILNLFKQGGPTVQKTIEELAIEGAAVPELVKLKNERDAKLAQDWRIAPLHSGTR